MQPPHSGEPVHSPGKCRWEEYVMTQDAVSAPVAERISQATFDLLSRAWRENRTIYEVLTVLGIAGEYRAEWLARWGSARPRKLPVEEGRPGPSGYGGLAYGGQIRRPELGIAFSFDGINHYRGFVDDPRWQVADVTSHERAMPHRTPEGAAYRFERPLDLERTLQEHNALDDMPAVPGAIRPWEYTTLSGVRGPTWAMWTPAMEIPSRHAIWPLGGQRPVTAGDHAPRPLDLFVGCHLEEWCSRLADEAGAPLTEEERAGIRRAAALWSEGRHYTIMSGHPRQPRAIARPDWWATMSDEERAMTLATEAADAARHTGIEYGDPPVRNQMAWLLNRGPENDDCGPVREWARAQLAADIKAALA